MNVIISVEKKINPLNTFGRLWDSGVQVLKIFDLVRLILCFCDDATAFDLFSAAPDLLSQNSTQYLRKNRAFDKKTIRIRNQTTDQRDRVFCYSLDESDVTDSLKFLKLFRDHYYFNLHKNQERNDHGPNDGNEHLNTESGKSKIFLPKLVALFLELHIQKELKKITLSLPSNKDVNLFRIAGNALLQQQIINNARAFVEKNFKSTLFPSDDADAVSLIKSFEDDVWEGKWFQHICGLQITSKNKVAANVLFALGLQEIEVQKLYQQQQQKHLQSTDEKSISFESHLRKLRIGHFDSGALDCFQYYSFLHLQELRLTRIRFEHVLELARLYDDCVPQLSKLFMVICVDIPESKDESSGSSSDDDSEYDYADDDDSKNEEQSGKYVVDQFNKGDDEHDQKYECNQNDKQVPNNCKRICFPNSLQHLSVAFDLGQQFQHSEETETENNVFITHIRPTIIHSICSLHNLKSLAVNFIMDFSPLTHLEELTFLHENTESLSDWSAASAVDIDIDILLDNDANCKQIVILPPRLKYLDTLDFPNVNSFPNTLQSLTLHLRFSAKLCVNYTPHMASSYSSDSSDSALHFLPDSIEKLRLLSYPISKGLTVELLPRSCTHFQYTGPHLEVNDEKSWDALKSLHISYWRMQCDVSLPPIPSNSSYIHVIFEDFLQCHCPLPCETISTGSDISTKSNSTLGGKIARWCRGSGKKKNNFRSTPDVEYRLSRDIATDWILDFVIRKKQEHIRSGATSKNIYCANIGAILGTTSKSQLDSQFELMNNYAQWVDCLLQSPTVRNVLL